MPKSHHQHYKHRTHKSHREHHSNASKGDEIVAAVESFVDEAQPPEPQSGPWSEWAIDAYGRCIYRCRRGPDGQLEYDFRDPPPAYARRSLTVPGEVGAYYAPLVIPTAVREAPQYESVTPAPSEHPSPPASQRRESAQEQGQEQDRSIRPHWEAADPDVLPHTIATDASSNVEEALISHGSDDADRASVRTDSEDSNSHSNGFVTIPVKQIELGIAWDKKSRRRIAAEKNKKVSARAKVHGWLPSLE